MKSTPNLNLMLTPSNDTTTVFKDWRMGINGDTGDSNMSKLDRAYGELYEQTNNIQTKLDAVADKVFGNEPKTWKDVQTIVRNGAAAQYFEIGDQFAVDLLSSMSADIGKSTGITSALVDSNTFISKRGEVCTGEYLFSYDGFVWRTNDGEVVNLSDYGISTTGNAVAGDQVIVSETAQPIKFNVIGIDHDKPSDPKLSHSMTLQIDKPWIGNTTRNFNLYEPEAAWSINKKTYPNGLAPGIYTFHWNEEFMDIKSGDYQFELSKSVPADGQILISFPPHGISMEKAGIHTYASIDALDSIESGVKITPGANGISLGIISNIQTNETNHYIKIISGSHQWNESPLRRFMNSNWKDDLQTSPFQRPLNGAIKSFTEGLDPAFLSVLGGVLKTTNGGSDDANNTISSIDHFFLLSLPEIYGISSQESNEGDVYDYYGPKYSTLPAPGLGADTNRSGFRSCLRTPHTPARGNYMISANGSISSGKNIFGYAICPACVIV